MYDESLLGPIMLGFLFFAIAISMAFDGSGDCSDSFDCRFLHDGTVEL